MQTFHSVWGVNFSDGDLRFYSLSFGSVNLPTRKLDHSDWLFLSFFFKCSSSFSPFVSLVLISSGIIFLFALRADLVFERVYTSLNNFPG